MQAGPTTSAQDEFQGLLVGLTNLLTLVPVMNFCVAEMQVVRQRGVLSLVLHSFCWSVGRSVLLSSGAHGDCWNTEEHESQDCLKHQICHMTRHVTRHITRHVTRQMMRHITRHVTRDMIV